MSCGMEKAEGRDVIAAGKKSGGRSIHKKTFPSKKKVRWERGEKSETSFNCSRPTRRDGGGSNSSRGRAQGVLLTILNRSERGTE